MMCKQRDEIRNKLMAGILEELNFFEEVTDELVLEVIDRILKSSENCHTLSLNRRCALREELFHSIRRLDVLEKLLEDESVTELARMLGGAEITERTLESAKEMKDLAWKQKSERVK